MGIDHSAGHMVAAKEEPPTTGNVGHLIVPKEEPLTIGNAGPLRVPNAEPPTNGNTGPLKVPKAEPQVGKVSPISVLRKSPTYLSSSSTSSSEDEPERSSDSDDSSDHSDRSDSEVDYKAESEDEEDEEYRTPRAKKQKVNRSSDENGSRGKKKSRVKTTAKRSDCYAPKQRTTNPGRRVVGSRIYDSVLGRTCHWCRQKTVELHVECSRCPIRFCGQCLLNRNGEIVAEEMKIRWICPKCRGGCGTGCKNCCNCGPCRKSQNFEPTGQVINIARRAGFSNVHDYLVHQKTDEASEVIAMRKEGRGWTKASGAPVYRSEDEDHVVKQDEEEEDHDVMQEEEEEHFRQETDEDKEDDHAALDWKSVFRTDFLAASRQRSTSTTETEHTEVEHSEQFSDHLSSNCRDGFVIKAEPAGQRYPRVQENEGRQSLTGSNSDRSETTGSRRQSAVQTPTSGSCVDDPDSTEDYGPSSYMQQNDFAMKLELSLQRPFSTFQLRQMWEHVNYRKPVTKIRHTRSRAIEVQCATDGLSYLDHYPDLAEQLEKSSLPETKLTLLRGFFFWLQHSCMEGAFRPWANAAKVDDTDECTEISGPDCQIIGVLLSIDEDEADNGHNVWEDRKPVIDGKAKEKEKETRMQAVLETSVLVKLEKED